MILSVITSYYNRPKALDRFKNYIEKVKNQNIEFIIEEWKEDTMFSTAICHNRAVEKSKGKWILKQDIDCICEYSLYDRILDLIKDKDYTFFANFGCINYVRAGKTDFPTGNQYICSKQLYLKIYGEPEFNGYGHEDYAFLYKLAKFQDENFKLEYNENNVDAIIRDQLARKLNKQYKDYFFTHIDHERQPKEMRIKFIENKQKLYEICKEVDND